MIITLVSHEKNLGILTLTDFLLTTLGNCAVVGSNYLVSDLNTLKESIDKFSSENKNVIIKYVIPKQKFSNQDVVYPKFLEEKSDFVLRVPKFIEEVSRPIKLEVLKGQDNPILEKVKEYYK